MFDAKGYSSIESTLHSGTYIYFLKYRYDMTSDYERTCVYMCVWRQYVRVEAVCACVVGASVWMVCVRVDAYGVCVCA